MALVLYLAVGATIAALWSRHVQRISVAAAIAVVALPLVFTGKAILTNRVYAPLDLPFTAEPLRDYARDYGVETPHDIALSDLHCQIIPWQQAVRSALAQGEWPLWNPFILNGDILAAAAQPAVYDPLQLLGMILPLPDALTFSATMTFFIAAFFTFLFARRLGLGEIASLVAAAGFAFCGMMAFFVSWPLARSWSWLPLVLLAVHRVVRARTIGAAAMLAIAFVMVIVSGHPESVLHIVAVGAAYGLALRPSLRAAGLATGAGVAALLLTAIYLLPFAEAAPQTLEYKIRRELYAPTSYDVIVSAKTRHERIARTFIPFAARDLAQQGGDPLSARVGVVILLLAMAAVLVPTRSSVERRPLPAAGPNTTPTGIGRLSTGVLFWLGLAIVSLCATFGAWPVAHLLHKVPLFDIAINERLAFAAAFALSMLAAITVDRIPQRGIAVLLLALVLLERANEDGGLYPALPKETFYPRTPLIAAVPRDGRIAGVGSALIPNNAALYGLEDARGYEAMTFLRLYETYPLWSEYQRAWFNRIDDLSRPFLSFLNVRYAFAEENAGVPDGWRVRSTDRTTRLLENTRALPRAFVPARVFYVRGNPVEAMKSVSDFRDAAWMETQAYEPHEAVNGAGSVSIRRDGLAWRLEANMQQAGWVVISETAWPGWRAYIDGRRVQTHFANHAFLGVFVPAGQHQVLLRYLPESFTRGRWISGLTLLLLAAAGVCYRTRVCSRSSSIPRSLSS